MEFNDYSKDGMKEEIEAHFKEHYGLEEGEDGSVIEYVCPAFDIKDYFEVVSHFQEWQAKKRLIDNFLEGSGAALTEDDYREKMALGSDGIMRNMPTQPGEGCCASEVPLDLDMVTNELNRYKMASEELEATANTNEAGSDVRQEKFTGTCIIVLKK